MLVVMSGGQSGVDRAALDAARAAGIAYGGWCPKGGWAEDMAVPPGLLAHYPGLRETPLADPAQRTSWNVRDSDAILIILGEAGIEVSPGTGLAEHESARCAKPLLVVDTGDGDALKRTQAWLAGVMDRHGAAPLKLGIGGPRESEAPGIYARALPFLSALLAGA